MQVTPKTHRKRQQALYLGLTITGRSKSNGIRWIRQRTPLR
jgi:hypothetical protein